jgi:hypothetical protein
MQEQVLKVPNVQFTEEEQLRWDLWKAFRRAGKTDLDIALKFGLKGEKQIQRLKHKAKLNGAYKEWMQEFLNESHEEFWQLHNIVKVQNPEVAYTQMGRIIERELAQKQEVELTETHINIDAQVSELIKISRVEECNNSNK